jgi:hypothetical protein
MAIGDVQTRLDWLRRQLPAEKAQRAGSFRPQPYQQLAQVLRAQGHEGEALDILVGMAEDRRKYGGLGLWSWFWTLVLWHVLRNGYRPLRAICWLLVLWLANGVVFGVGYDAGLIGPTDQKAFRGFCWQERNRAGLVSPFPDRDLRDRRVAADHQPCPPGTSGSHLPSRLI